MASNPLLAAAAKKSKKPHTASQAASTKRKYTEETPGGLLIVRAQSADAPTRSAPARQPTAGPSKPPAAKKFKADTLTVPTHPPARNASVDPVVEQAVRDMEDEADSLRRAARPTTNPSPPTLAFSPAKPPPKPARAKKKPAPIETQEPLRDGTPQGARNKLLRGDAMAAIARGRTPEPDTPGHRRRSSLGGRGKRISNSFQGGFALPHAKVGDESLYKHIDHELSDAEQLRQLLTWCASRAAEAGPSAHPIPPVDAAAMQTIKGDMVNMLAERYIDLSLFGPDEDQPIPGVGKNAQNEKNRRWEKVYSEEIERAAAEREEWNKARYYHDAYRAKEEKRLVTRRAEAEAKGKGRATDDSADPWPWPDARVLPQRLQHGLRLAQAGPTPDPPMDDVPFALAALHTHLHAARTCVRVAGRVLDARFGLLGEGITGSTGAGATGEGGSREGAHGLMRALARVDMARPPGMVGDAARRAAREVQRAAKAGEGERRVTLTAPGTPRRAGTPRRERTPGRDRTPGR
ncbi:Mis12-Mtw1 protein family-domain-containing protein [Mycena belliarum]|uniref:Mis12-Mtw1 protein family-domain-containing protein n=1 Tax=Mycena belliarum TaxID=1033014 RepID=A0AAD6Y1D4_9AGAR|nr:Mis12-Mtw1 protein family-domain-containing protein [Mycena belliae]